MHPVKKLIFFLCLLCGAISTSLYAQTVDTTVVRQVVEASDTLELPTITNPAFEETDSAKLIDPRARIPRIAATRSAILPGWGQVYNRDIWKVPLVYGALGATGGLFVNNLVWHKRFKTGVRVIDALQKSTENPKDSSAYNNLDRFVKVIFERNGIETIRYQRDYYRKNLDYAAIYFIIAWGLNVMEATVDAHLSSFDVSPDLTFKIQPGYSPMAQTAGLSLLLKVK